MAARRRSTAIVGAGWAGLAAAVEAVGLGDAVTVFEMAPTLGGRARSVELPFGVVDNGQHIAIGAYRETLRLMALLGVEEADAFMRIPLALLDADGAGLRLRRGPPALAFARAVLGNHRWPWADRLGLLRASSGWLIAGFTCPPSTTVAELTRSLPIKARDELIEPLCVAALNTPAVTASAQVFLRVLRDALFSGAGSSDLLLPRQPLGELLPAPAARWLVKRGASLNLSTRVGALAPTGHATGEHGWLVDGARFDRVILATSSSEAARLAAPIAPAWSSAAAALRHEAIVTVYARSKGSALPHPMLLLHATPTEPAQFVFDRGQLGGPAGLFAFVVSGANDWLGKNDDIERAVLAQATKQLGAQWKSPLRGAQVITEKRATFACTPALARPLCNVAPGLVAAGDYIAGPYPATLEGAVRSGQAAARMTSALILQG